MAKQDEIDYLKNLGSEGIIHAYNKPFSDENCGLYLTDMGTIMSLMPQPPARVLDLGAGTGWTSLFFAQRGYDVVGQDIAPDMIELANKKKDESRLENLSFVVSDYEEMDFCDEFDVAVFYDALHHCIDERQAVKSAYEALKPNGILITVEPGSGHADSEPTREAVRKFGVTEKDMPPRLVISLGKEIGFRKWQLFQRYSNPVMLGPANLSYVLALMISLKNYFIGRHMRRNHIVVLTK